MLKEVKESIYCLKHSVFIIMYSAQNMKILCDTTRRDIVTATYDYLKAEAVA